MDYHVSTMSHNTMYVSDHHVNRVDTFAYQWLETELRQVVFTQLADKKHRRIHAALWACAGIAPHSGLMQTWPCLQSTADARGLHRRQCCGRTPISASALAPAGPRYVRHKAISPHTRPEQHSTEVASRVRLCLGSLHNSSHTFGPWLPGTRTHFVGIQIHKPNKPRRACCWVSRTVYVLKVCSSVARASSRSLSASSGGSEACQSAARTPRPSHKDACAPDGRQYAVSVCCAAKKAAMMYLN